MSKYEMFTGFIATFVLVLGFLVFYLVLSSIMNYSASEYNKAILLLKKYPECATAYNINRCVRTLDNMECSECK